MFCVITALKDNPPRVMFCFWLVWSNNMFPFFLDRRVINGKSQKHENSRKELFFRIGDVFPACFGFRSTNLFGLVALIENIESSKQFRKIEISSRIIHYKTGPIRTIFPNFFVMAKNIVTTIIRRCFEYMGVFRQGFRPGLRRVFYTYAYLKP